MLIFPAIDLIGKQAVRLCRGDYNEKTVYSNSPALVAASFAEQGATCLHLVDLDGAKSGSPCNFSVVCEIVKACPKMFIEIGGGIRDEKRICEYLECGVSRVILGTAAIKSPVFTREMLKQYGKKIAIGVDAKNGFVASEGWLDVSSVSGVDFCKNLAQDGASSVIYTDISTDGMLCGTNLAVFEQLAQIDGLQITASGGITFLQEIETLAQMGIHSAIVGKAVYEGKLSLAEALRVAKGKA